MGNIPDVETSVNLLSDFATPGFSKVKLVTDHRFYIESNINALFKTHLKFLIPAKMSLFFAAMNWRACMIVLVPSFPTLRKLQYGTDAMELHRTPSLQRRYTDRV